MANEPSIQTTDLNEAFRALRNSDPSKVSKQNIPNHPDYKRIPSQNYGPIASVNTGNWGNGGNGSAMTRSAQSITYGQPQFFSPVHTAINWQLPSKNLEINQWCLTPWNRILCENYTYKEIKDIAINDKVLCEDSTFRCVDKIGIREVDEDIYQLEIQSERDLLEITGNHKIFCVRSEDVACKYKLDRPSPQKCTPLFGTPCATYKDRLHKCEKTELNIQKIPVTDIKENDYVLFPIPKEIIPNEEINENRARLLGYYTAEGCCTLKPDKSIYQIQWTLNADEIDTLGKEICDLFEIEFGKRPRLRIKPKTPNTLHVLVQSREGLAFFKKYCPGLAPTKVLEQSILTLDPNLQKHIAACYISGDGHFKYRDDKLVEVSFCSASEKLLEQFRIMLARCNISTTGIWTTNNTILYKGKNKNFLCYTCAFSYSALMNLGSIFVDKVVGEKKYNPKNQTMICQGYILKRITKITKKHYQGPVYNLEVNTIHSYVANGLLVCNCRFFYCLTPDNKILMANGTEKKICEIIVGDKIIDENGNSQNVLKVHSRNIDEKISELTLSRKDEKISITKSHEIKIVKQGDLENSSSKETWFEVKDVQIGDYMISPRSKNDIKEYSQIINKEEKHYSGIVYDLEIENNHTYCVNGCVVHNSNEPKVAAAVDFYCFAPETPILMADGRQQCISSIAVGDSLRSHDGTVNKVEKINIRNAEDEEILKIKISGTGGTAYPKMRVTGGHMVLTEREGVVDFVPASTLNVGEYLLTPCNYVDNNSNTISDDLAWLIGIYAAEGWTIPYNHTSKTGVDRRDYKGVKFGININEEELEKTIIDKINKIYGGVTITTCVDEEHHTRVIKVYGQQIGDDLCGASPGTAKSHSKRLSPWVMNLKKSNLINLLSGFLSGDGCYNETNGFQGVGNSKILLEQMANICDMLGLEYSFTVSRISSEDQRTSYNLRISRRACSVFENLSYKMYESTDLNYSHANNIPYFIKENYIYRKITAIEKKLYSGPLYDLSIQNSHSYVANRVAVHNSSFPMNDYTHECKDRKVKLHFDALKKRLDLNKWTRLIAHELIMLGNCFAFLEINCEACGGSGKVGDQICEHEGATIKRLILLNPDNVEVQSTPMNPDPLISLKPNEELMTMVQKKIPGYEKLDPNVAKLIAAGRPIRLDNRNIFHLKHGESGYAVHGEGMIRRLFPILSYKTKIMVAQWIIAERLILPIKIVKVGSDERPAGPADIASVQAQLAQTANDPSLTLVTHHNFDLEYYGACYSNDTEVLTENGWKLYKDVSKNYDEKIATYNLDKNAIEYDIPQEYHEYDFNGDMVLFKNENVDILVTPNHNMLACTEYSNVFEKIQAKQIAESKKNYYFKKAVENNQDDTINGKYLIVNENVSNFNYNGKVWCFTVKNGFFVTRRNGKIGIHGNSGKILQISNEFEFISQEINDGLMISNELINGSGPSISGGQAGIEAMVQRLESFRNYISDWIENFIYLPEAKRQGFITHNEDTDQDEYVVPTIKWNKMHLRDQQQDKQFAMQLYEKGLLSAHTMLEIFGYDPDMEVERKRYDSVQMMALGQGQGQQGGAGGGMGGGGGGGLMGDLGGMGGGGGPDMGGAGGGMGGEPGGAPISAPAGGGEAPAVTKATTFTAEVADISQFGGRVLKQKTRDKIQHEQARTFKQTNQAKAQNASNTTRDEKGRIIFTKPERDLIGRLQQAQKDGIIKYSIIPQFKMQMTDREYLIDFAIPQLKLGIEADGEMFHSNPKQKQHDKERDIKLAQCGWTILRFMDTEIEKKAQQVIATITQAIVKKEEFIKNSNAKIENKQL